MSTKPDSAVASLVLRAVFSDIAVEWQRVEWQRKQGEKVRATLFLEDIAKWKQKDVFYADKHRQKSEAVNATDEQPGDQPMESSNTGQLLRPNASREATTTQPAEISATETLGATWGENETSLDSKTTERQDGIWHIIQYDIGEELVTQHVETTVVPATCDEENFRNFRKKRG